MLFRTSTMILAGAAATAGSAIAASDARSPKDAKQLAQALAGRTAQPATNCIPNRPTTRMEIIDDHTILFRQGGTVYVQNPPGGCSGIGNGMYTLVTKPLGGSELCKGDLNQLVDRTSRIRGGACAFGPFVPYR